MDSKSNIENTTTHLSESQLNRSGMNPQSQFGGDSGNELEPSFMAKEASGAKMDSAERRLDYIPISPQLIEHVRRIDGFNVSAT